MSQGPPGTRQEREDGSGRENTRLDRRDAPGSRYGPFSDLPRRSWTHRGTLRPIHTNQDATERTKPGRYALRTFKPSQSHTKPVRDAYGQF